MTNCQLTVWLFVSWRNDQMPTDGRTIKSKKNVNWRCDKMSTNTMTKYRVRKMSTDCIWPNDNYYTISKCQLTSDGMINCQLTVWRSITNQNTLCPNVNWRYDEEYGNKISTNCLTKWQLTVWPSINWLYD